tara:strand:- start:1426 stop:2505 length:1080 start_codon:yes stop_codon:yes gene_type:complete
MASALSLARRGLGGTWPNPAVGCVLVNSGNVVGRGWTQVGGRPHAEIEALRMAGPDAKGGVAYITLEPCSHVGMTRSCAEALVEAGIQRAVFAVRDPDHRVDGRGCEILTNGGVEVTEGLCSAEAMELNIGFFTRVKTGRPLITLKLASTLDGRIAAHDGSSRWITGEEARAQVHMLRARVDAVMIGSRTLSVDNPDLTCRLPGLEMCSPVRVIVDSKLCSQLDSKVVSSALTVPTWVITIEGADKGRKDALTGNGVTVVEVPSNLSGKVEIGAAMKALGDRGLTHVVVEGGGELAGALINDRLVDRLVWFHAPKILGSTGVPSVVTSDFVSISDSCVFQRISTSARGGDSMSQFVRIE